MNNNTSRSICGYPDWFFVLGEGLNCAQYTVFLPLYATVGVFGHLLCVAAFVKQARKENAYLYQLFLEITECFRIVAFIFYLLAFLGSGIERDGYGWYQKNYFLMWYTAYMAVPVVTFLAMCCNLLNVAMAADRVFALLKPFVYKTIKHKSHQCVALVLSLLLGFSVTLLNFRLFKLQNIGDRYIVVVDIDYVGTLASMVLFHIANNTRTVCLLMLIASNVIILHKFRKHLRHKAKMNTTETSRSEKKREVRDKGKKERSLIFLTTAQSFFGTLTRLSHILFMTAVYTVPTFHICDNSLYAPLFNVGQMCCDIAKIFVIASCDRKTRDTVRKLLHDSWNHIKVG